MKKSMKIALAIAICVCLVAGGIVGSVLLFRKDKKADVVVTIFPQYDWLINILGDNPNDYNIKYLLGTGLDLHNYSPSAKDIMTIAECKLFIYVGGESDEWVEEVLTNNPNPNRKVISLVEAIEAGHEHEEEHEEEEHEEEHGEGEHNHADHDDEHVWLSLVNAQVLVDVIAETLGEIDEDNAELYEDNAHEYMDKIQTLHEQYQGAMENVNAHDVRIVVADRNPFLLMFDDYHIHDDQITSAFEGCAAQIEVTFQIKTDLIAFVNSNGVDVILTIEKPSTAIGNLANSVKIESNATGAILALHSGQNVSNAEIETGFTYLKMMTDNLTVFTQAIANWVEE